MYKQLSIAICDDCAEDRLLIASCLSKYLDQHGYVAALSEYVSAEALLNAREAYDLIILDIFMGEMSGIEAARSLCEAAPDTRIIFCSSSNEFAAESYDVAALRYLTKPLSEEKLCQTLDSFFTVYTAMRTLEYRANRMSEHILLCDVRWIEADDHKSLIHTRQGIITTTTTLTQFAHQLADADFVKPIRYALVSLAAISTVPTDVLTLIDGTKIPISRDLREEMKKAYFSYKTRMLLNRQKGNGGVIHVMNNVRFSLFFAPVLLMSGTLSLAPFLKLLSRKQRGIIYGVYAFFLSAIIGVFYWAACAKWASFALVKHSLLFWGCITTLVHILVLPRHYREWLFSAALSTLFLYLIGAVATYLTYQLYGWNTLRSYAAMELTASILIGVSYWPIRRLIIKTIRPFLAYESTTYWRNIYMIPSAMLAACYFMLPGNAHMETLSQVASRLFMVATAFFICHSISADFELFQEKQAIKEQLRQQKLYYSSMRLNLENARRQRHDFKHHIVTIQHYVETDNKDGLREYCGELMLENEIKNPIPYSGNSAADGVIYHYMQQSAAQNIRFSFHGAIQSHGIADTDLCVLLGNALDNALAGCKTISENRFIRMTVLSEPQLFSVLIQNSFDGIIQEGKDGLLSRKRVNREGVGMTSMKTICQKYGGIVERSWEGNVFTLCIHLPLPEKEA